MSKILWLATMIFGYIFITRIQILTLWSYEHLSSVEDGQTSDMNYFSTSEDVTTYRKLILKTTTTETQLQLKTATAKDDYKWKQMWNVDEDRGLKNDYKRWQMQKNIWTTN